MSGPRGQGGPDSTQQGAGGKHPKPPKPPLAVRRERLLDEIALQRIAITQSAETVIKPLRAVDRFRQGAGQRRMWLYPAAPVLALLAWRLRPRLTSMPALAARAFAVWRIVRHFR
jgi:hypothetical protein